MLPTSWECLNGRTSLDQVHFRIRLLMVRKKMVKFATISDNNRTFAVLQRGMKLRRGASSERFGVVSGRLMACENLTLIEGCSSRVSLYLFLCHQAFLSVVNNCKSTSRHSLMSYKSSIYLNADSNKSITFASVKFQVIRFMVQLQIQVFASSRNKDEGRKLFERIKEVDGNLSIDFNGIAKVLRFLYGEHCIISFNILPI